MRKPAFCICKNKDADQLCGNREADHSFVLATRIVQSLYLLNPKFQASSNILKLYRLVYVRLVGNPKDKFSRDEAHISFSISIYAP